MSVTTPDSGQTPNSPGSKNGDIDMNLASPASEVLGKRKRDESDIDDKVDPTDDHDDNSNDVDDDADYGVDGFEANEDSLFVPDDEYFAPEDNEDDLEYDDVDAGNEDFDELDETAEAPQVTYSSIQETFPECAYYDEAIPAVVERVAAVPQKVLAILAKHKCDTKHVETQRRMAEALLSVPETTKLRVALLGDAGAGKSSLLNSVTDLDDIAKSLASGQSVTCVPTEYRGAFQNQRKNFAASVRYFDIPKIKQVLLEMLDDYNLFTFEYDRSWDEDTRSQYKKAMQNAEKTFGVLFCDLEQFATKATREAFLKRNYEDSSVKAINIMVKSCEKKLAGKPVVNGMYADFVEATTRAKFRELVDPLMMGKGNAGQSALWPVVQTVCIGVRGSRVLDKITLVDLPGISDTNTTRVELCKGYIKSCDFLWVVAPIRRVVDDGSVYNLLSTYGRIFKNNVMVICTHSDEGADRKLAMHLKDEDCDIQPYLDITEEWNQKRSEIAQQSAKIKALRNRKKPTKQVLIDAQTAEDDMKAMRAEWLAIDSRRFEFLVTSRNAWVTKELQEEMRYHLPEGEKLKVACVSNLHYSSLKGTAKVSGARLDAPSTGIPALRDIALALAAPSLLRTLEAYSNYEMASFLKSAHMWVNITTVERRAELLEFVDKPIKALARRFRHHEKVFKSTLVETIASSFNKDIKEMTKVALKMLEKKREKHHSTVRAFIRKNGKHKTGVCPKEAWNEHFSQAVIDTIQKKGPTWEASYKAKLDALRDSIIADFRQILVDLKAQPSRSVLPMKRFTELIESQVLGIMNVFSHSLEEYERGLRAIYLDMTQDSAANYFSRTMVPIYDKCNKDSGPGITKRSLTAIENHLQKENARSPFMIVGQSATNALSMNDSKHIGDRIKQQVEDIFNDTYQAFDRMIDRTKEDPKEAKARLDLKAHIESIQETFDAACLDLEAIKIKYADPVVKVESRE